MIKPAVLAQLMFISRPVGNGIVGNPCGAFTRSLSADITTGSWTPTGGPTTAWECLDDARGSTDTTDYINQFSNGGRQACVLRATLTGTCDVNSITIYTYAQILGGGTDDINFEVSPDNATWETIKTQNMDSNNAERNCSWTGLNWVNPAYCYVRINNAEADFNNCYMYNLQVYFNS